MFSFLKGVLHPLTIIEQYTAPLDFPAGVAIIVICFVLSMLLIIFGVYERETERHFGFGLWLIIMGILCFVLGLQLLIAWPQIDRYKAAYASDTTIQSVTEQYTIIGQEGDLLILEDKMSMHQQGNAQL